tara:strand:- start:6693 stop:7490 length:798 start_codon:yes stop_codon:yes gene_type:complete
MIRNTTYLFIFLFGIIYFYITFVFDINNYKTDLERIISKQANIDFKILGSLSLNLGVQSSITAQSIVIKKNNILLLESKNFNAKLSLSKILGGRFDIDAISLIETKLYGVNIDESIVKSYNILAGKNYTIKNDSYSDIQHIKAKGYYENEILQIKDIKFKTTLLNGEGFGNIKPRNQKINISVNTFILENTNVKEKYNKYYPTYLTGTQLPVLITGNYNNPDINIKISDVITKKLEEEIKNKAIKSIKDKIKDKIKSEINIRLPF